MPSSRFTVFVPNLDDGPVQRAMVAAANGILRRGFAVDIVAPMGGGPLRAGLAAGVGQIDLAKRHTATSVLALARILAERRPAGLLSAGRTAGMVALAAAIVARSGTRVAVMDATMDGGAPEGRLRAALRRRLYRRAALVIDGIDGGDDTLDRYLSALES